MAHRQTHPGADPLNLWGNAREGSTVQTGLEPGRISRMRPQTEDPGTPPVVHVSGVSRAYEGRDGAAVTALADISLHADTHELLAVVGPSGCGKTTLLELICDLQRPDRGTIECVPAALMPQQDLLLPWLSALDNAALALRIAHVPRAQARGRASELFAELGLAGFERAHPHELSGGMRQRVAFVRTLLSGKQLLCLDEPFGALDAITRAEMHTWLVGALTREPRSVVLVTHDVEEAVVLADRVAVLSPRPGRVVGEVEVTLGYPRSRTDPEVVALRERALLALGGGSGDRDGSENREGSETRDGSENRDWNETRDGSGDRDRSGSRDGSGR
jgi:ABC-type nitrate/sulfonate/bicarbonate transport system ATPase subunit